MVNVLEIVCSGQGSFKAFEKSRLSSSVKVLSSENGSKVLTMRTSRVQILARVGEPLKKVTAPDSSAVSYTYDIAQRLIPVCY